MTLRNLIAAAKEMLDDARKDWFYERTNTHIELVRKYLAKILDADLSEVDPDLLKAEFAHDQGKFEDPELEPYVHITWKYRMQDMGKQYEPPAGIDEQMHAATFHHIKNNKHHPEYWDKNVTTDALSSSDRDNPGKQMVDATAMPPTYVASMVADWLAMSEEKGTNARQWADKNINVRWKFTPEQSQLIYKIINTLQE